MSQSLLAIALAVTSLSVGLRAMCVGVPVPEAKRFAPAFDGSAQSNKTLPCVPAPAADGAPWEHNSRVLESFPPDNPLPRFLGSFSDAASTYRLHMWRDAKGIFGELLSPLLDADSPTSRLYEPRFDAASGKVAFVVHFPPEQWAFSGVLRSNTLSGRFQRGTRNEAVVLRRLHADALGQALRESVTSRAGFDCSMILFHRY